MKCKVLVLKKIFKKRFNPKAVGPKIVGVVGGEGAFLAPIPPPPQISNFKGHKEL